MSSEVFVWVNLGIGFLLILLVWVGKRGALKPSSLNLRRGGGDADLRKPTTAAKNATQSDVHFQSKPQDPLEAKMKNLNVIFMFNGHSFDAYEVLGVPAGANLEMTEKAYREIIKNKPSDNEFFTAAWAAIKHDRS
jgi:hypothetical protein